MYVANNYLAILYITTFTPCLTMYSYYINVNFETHLLRLFSATVKLYLPGGIMPGGPVRATTNMWWHAYTLAICSDILAIQSDIHTSNTK